MKPFVPHNLPIKALNWSLLIDLIGQANGYVARYDSLLHSIPNADVLMAPLRTNEAVLSSKIEGTRATLQEVMQFESDEKAVEEKHGDIHEIINYRIALSNARDRMEQKPLSLGVIREMHKTLMSGVRGQNKDAGNFRRIQNHIGAPGSTLETARFVPPSPIIMKESLYNWEKYLHIDDKDVLVQLAIVHGQFEIIHPFLDGNGRIGRILIPLFLYHKKVIQEPVFYMSEYLESHRTDYYDALKNISDNNDWEHWIRFFLNGVITQSEKSISQLKRIINLYDAMKLKIAEKTHSQFSIKCLDFIFSTPFFNTKQFRVNSGIPKSSIARLLKSLEASKIIHCIQRGSGRRASFFIFLPLMNIINERS